MLLLFGLRSLALPGKVCVHALLHGRRERMLVNAGRTEFVFILLFQIFHPDPPGLEKRIIAFILHQPVEHRLGHFVKFGITRASKFY
ncbi:hypothetical protein DMP17_07195 [Pseudonocardia sp. TMWB2A]